MVGAAQREEGGGMRGAFAGRWSRPAVWPPNSGAQSPNYEITLTYLFSPALTASLSCIRQGGAERAAGTASWP